MEDVDGLLADTDVISDLSSPGEGQRNAIRPKKRRSPLTVDSQNEKKRTKATVRTYVKTGPQRFAVTLFFFCSKVSPANWGSSLTVTLYRKMIIDRIATASVSKNLYFYLFISNMVKWKNHGTYFLPKHARAPLTETEGQKLGIVLDTSSNQGISPALNGRNASRGQSCKKRPGLNVKGSCQYRAREKDMRKAKKTHILVSRL